MAQEERRGLRHSGGVGDPHAGGVRLERRATTDPDQYSLGYEPTLPILMIIIPKTLFKGIMYPSYKIVEWLT